MVSLVEWAFSMSWSGHSQIGGESRLPCGQEQAAITAWLSQQGRDSSLSWKKGMELAQLVALSFMGDKPVSKKGMEPTQLVALSWMGNEAVSAKGIELAQPVALSLVGNQPLLKKNVEP